MRQRSTRQAFANLRAFCEFWVDRRPQIVCCQYVDDETLACEDFDCATCEVRSASDALWPENVSAWQLFQQISTRFVVDARLVGEAFRVLTNDWPTDAKADAFERLSVIYDVMNPRSAPPTE